MDERERQIRRQQRIRKQKRKRMITLGILALILVLIVVLVVMTFGKKKTTQTQTPETATTTPAEAQGEVEGEGEIAEEGDTADKSGDADDIEDADTSSEEEVTKAEQITLTQGQIYTGDLILVNSTYAYHFDENQSEIHLTDIGTYSGGIRVAREGLQLAERVMEPLYQMIQACNQELGVSDTGVTSAYRSEEYQQQTFDEYVEEFGQEYAESYVAQPGYSEHHTGLSLDMGIYYDDGQAGQFSGSNNATWMDQHCQEYGFVRRYKEEKVDITGISNESWHFRYVGVPHATYMNQQNLCLEEYIEYVRNNTSKDAPLEVTVGTDTYKIYSVKESNMDKPAGAYTVSGDNIDGYIITEG